MIKQVIFLVLMLIVVIPISFAAASTDYNLTGGGNSYQRGDGIFNAELITDEETGNIVLNEGQEQHPLIADLDGDNNS